MALLTVPLTPEKGEILNFTLNTNELQALVSEIYYQDQLNWGRVLVAYRSLVDDQPLGLNFYPTGSAGETLSSTGIVDDTARNSFAIEFILIYDKQGGFYVVESQDIPDVTSYSLVFTDGSAFYSLYKFGQANTEFGIMQVAEDNIYLYNTGSSNKTAWGSKSFFQGVMGLDNGLLNNSLTKIVNNWRTYSYKFNESKSKLWAIGIYGTSYFNKTLPPVSTGVQYSANPMRVIELDVETGDVTWLCDLKSKNDNGTERYFAFNCIDDFYVDETASVVTIASFGDTYGVGGYASYDFSNNELWFKSSSSYAYGTGKRTLSNYDATYIFSASSSYQGTSISTFQLLKINKLTGELASVPELDSTKVWRSWAMTPDKTKIFVCGTSGGAAFATYTIASNILGPTSSVAVAVENSEALVATNSYVYFTSVTYDPATSAQTLSIQKVNHSFALESLVIRGVAGFGRNKFAATDDYVYFWDKQNYFVKASALDGTVSSAFRGTYHAGAAESTYTIGQLLDDCITIGLSDIENNLFYTRAPASNIVSSTMGTIDKSAKSLLSLEEISQIPNVTEWTIDLDPYWSKPLQRSADGKIFGFQMGNGKIFCYDTVTNTNITDYPSFNAYAGVGAVQIIGDWVYVMRQADVGTPWSVTDLSGTFTLDTLITRFSITTKLVDQSFAPSYASNFSGGLGRTIYLCETDNYFYVTARRDYDAIPGQVYRVNKASPSSCEFITAGSLGYAGNFTGRIMVYQTAPNKIIMVSDIPSTRLNYWEQPFQFDGKSYLKFSDEAALTIDASRPSTTDLFYYVAYNPTLSELAGYSASSGIQYLAYYGVSDNSENRMINISESPLISDDLIKNPLTGNFYSMFALESILPDGDAYFCQTTNAVMINGKTYNGVVRMKPFGIINNE